MKTRTYFLLAGLVLVGLNSCENQSLSKPLYYDPTTGAMIEQSSTTAAPTDAPAPTATPQVVAQPQNIVPAPQPQVAAPQPVRPTKQQKPAYKNNITGPFSAPDVTGLPSKEELRESETTNSSGSTPGITVPKR